MNKNTLLLSTILSISVSLNLYGDVLKKETKNPSFLPKQQQNMQKEDYILKAIKSVIPNTKIAKYGKSLIDGFYEIYFDNGQIIYVNPFKRLILFGEIWNDRGYSYTANDRQRWIQQLKSKNDKKIADKRKYEFVIFTDPDCPFCKRIEKYLIDKNINLYVNFMPLSIHPNAKQKSLKMLSSTNFEKLFLKHIDTNINLDKTKITSDAKEKLKNTQKIIKDIGLQEATPQIFVLDSKTKKVVSLIRGANKAEITKYLNIK